MSQLNQLAYSALESILDTLLRIQRTNFCPQLAEEIQSIYRQMEQLAYN